MKRTQEQNIKFHALINELRFDKEEKREIVLTFSANRVTSSADLTFQEMDLAIKYLESQKENSLKKMRSKIINIGKDIGLMKDGLFDFKALNVFLNKKFKKHLHELTREELPKAVTSMEAWKRSLK